MLIIQVDIINRADQDIFLWFYFCFVNYITLQKLKMCSNTAGEISNQEAEDMNFYRKYMKIQTGNLFDKFRKSASEMVDKGLIIEIYIKRFMDL